MKTAVLTVAIGDEWQRILESSGPTIEAYARKMGSDYFVIRNRTFPTQYAAYEKLRVRDILKSHDRALLIDADCIVRPDTPDLFSIVPEGSFGAVLVPPPVGDKEWVNRVYREHAARLKMEVPDHGGRYFSTGVVVCDRSHHPVFADPPTFQFVFYEQTYICIQVARLKIPLFPIPPEFNCWHVGNADQVYVAHYSRSVTKLPIDQYVALLEGQKRSWELLGPLRS